MVDTAARRPVPGGAPAGKQAHRYPPMDTVAKLGRLFGGSSRPCTLER